MSTALIAASPILFLVIDLIFWFILRLIKPRIFKKNYLRNAMLTFFTMLYLIYPTITQYTFAMFDCINVDGILFLRRDFSIECWTSYHIKLILAFALPISTIWIFGFPLVIFFILKKNKAHMNDRNMIIKYGTFYIGLNDNSYFW